MVGRVFGGRRRPAPPGGLSVPSREFRRFLSGGPTKDAEEAKAFLLRLRHSPEVADGVISALKSSGALLPTLYAMAGAWVRAAPSRPTSRNIWLFPLLPAPPLSANHLHSTGMSLRRRMAVVQ